MIDKLELLQNEGVECRFEKIYNPAQEKPWTIILTKIIDPDTGTAHSVRRTEVNATGATKTEAIENMKKAIASVRQAITGMTSEEITLVV